MRLKLLFLTIAMFFIVPSLANAAIEWEFDFSKLNQTKFFEIDMANTTALIDLESNNSQVGFAYACHYEGQAVAPSCWTVAYTATISTVNFDNHANSMKVTENGAGHGEFVNNMAEGIGQAFILNKVIAPGTGASQFVLGHTDDTTYTSGAGFKTVVDPNNIYLGENPVTNTNIRTSDNASWFYARIDSVANTEHVSNFTNSFTGSMTSGTPTRWRIQSMQNTAADFYIAYVKLWSSTAARNISENKIQWNATIATSTNAFTINVETDDIAKVNVSVSCDEGANFVSGAANTTLTCSVGSTNKPVVFVEFNHTLGNLSYISLSPIASAADTTPPSVNITNFNATIKKNDRLNISCQSFDTATIGNITFNLTGNADLYNFSFSLSGASANYSQNITMNLTRSNVVNATCWARDSSANVAQNSTLITVADTVQNTPTIQYPTLNTLYTISNIDLNLTWLLDADEDAVTDVYWWVNTTSKTNQSISVSGGNTGNTTFNASDGKYNLSVSICDAFGCSANITIASFKIDTVNPITNLTTALPNMTFIRTNINYTIGAEDSNLEVHNVTCFSGDDITGTMQFSSEANLTGTINTFNLEINTSWGDGRYTCLSNASDDHTAKIDKNYTLTKDIATLKLDFLTSESRDDVISIKLKSADIGLLDFYAYKSNDETKYIYVFNFSNTSVNSNINHTYIIKYASKNHKLSHRSKSKFKSHFTTPYNWIDCNLRSNYSGLTSYSVKEALADSGQFETNITTPETTLICDSIGGKNRIGQRTQAEIDTGIPQFFSLNVSRNGLMPNNTFFNTAFLNISFNVSDKNINSTLFYINNNKNISVLVIASNSTQNATITFPDGNYTILVEINDSAGNKINSTLLNVVVDTVAPVFSTAINRTTTNSTIITTTTDVNITINSLGDIYLNRGNFSHNASGSWTNHSINIISNNTYYYIIGSGNFSITQIVGWKFYAYDLAGNELDPIYTFEVGSPIATSTITGGGGGSSGGSFNLDQLECNQKAKPQNRCLTYNPDSKSCELGCQSGYACNEDFVCEGTFLQPDYIPLANLLIQNLQEEQCSKQGYSFFQNSCYNCNGKLVNLKGTIVCLQCKDEYKLNENNVCIQTLQQRTTTTSTPIDKLAKKISPNNPFLGFLIMVGIGGILIYAYSNRTIIKTKYKKG